MSSFLQHALSFAEDLLILSPDNTVRVRVYRYLKSGARRPYSALALKSPRSFAAETFYDCLLTVSSRIKGICSSYSRAISSLKINMASTASASCYRRTETGNYNSRSSSL